MKTSKLIKNYGKELILDLHYCNPDRFTRDSINTFFKELCNIINMEPEQVNWWDYKNYKGNYDKLPPHLKGTSAVQFISTSNITIHTLDDLRCVYLNIFSCKSFKSTPAKKFAIDFFGGKIINATAITRI